MAAKKKTQPAVKLVDLTPAEVAAMPKARDGFEKHVESLLTLAEKDASFRPKGFDPVKLRATLAVWHVIQDMERQAAKQLEMIQETKLMHSASLWTSMLDIYARAQAAARRDPDTARAISDFVDFMKTGPRKKPTP